MIYRHHYLCCTIYRGALSPSGATRLPPFQFETTSDLLFLSSLDCTDEDHSLLSDCTHDRLGLATCGDDLGLAVAKCYGNESIQCSVIDSLVPRLSLCSRVITTDL